MVRAFIAVRLVRVPAPLCSLASRLQGMGRAVKAVAVENLHVTLRFLGDTEPSLFDAITGGIRQIVEECKAKPFAFEMVGLGAFPHIRRPSVVWVGAANDEPLRRIVAALNPKIDALGFGGDAGGREWGAHMTLARIKARPPESLFELLQEHERTHYGPFAVASIDLMLSALTSAGPTYSVAASVKL